MDHTFIKDDQSAAVALIEQTDNYIDDMKKGTSNILVRLNTSLTNDKFLMIGRCPPPTPVDP